MDLISVDVRNQTRQERTSARVKSLIEFWKTRQDKMIEYVASKPPTEKQLNAELILEDRQERTPIWIALPVVLDRTLRNTWRQPDIFWTRWTQAPILSDRVRKLAPFSVPVAVAAALSVARGLDAFHKMDLVHGDVGADTA